MLCNIHLRCSYLLMFASTSLLGGDKPSMLSQGCLRYSSASHSDTHCQRSRKAGIGELICLSGQRTPCSTLSRHADFLYEFESLVPWKKARMNSSSLTNPKSPSARWSYSHMMIQTGVPTTPKGVACTRNNCSLGSCLLRSIEPRARFLLRLQSFATKRVSLTVQWLPPALFAICSAILTRNSSCSSSKVRYGHPPLSLRLLPQ